MTIISFDEVENKIITIHGIQVILDCDVAELYGVQTKEVNQAFSNNLDKFPAGYVFNLSKKEKAEVVKNFYHLNRIKYSPYQPKAFTEKGLYMLATILKSEQATQTTIAIIEAFSKTRNLSRNISLLSKTVDSVEKEKLLQNSGEMIAEILGPNLVANESETTIELNFAVLKFKHTLKKKDV